jgi:ankyrin repeat protein
VKKQEAEDILEEACSSTELLPLVRLMLEKGADVNARYFGDITPLHRSASFSPEVVELLVEKGAKIEAGDLSGKTPLHMAAFSGNDRTKGGKTPLRIAVEENHAGLIKYLKERGGRE